MNTSVAASDSNATRLDPSTFTKALVSFFPTDDLHGLSTLAPDKRANQSMRIDFSGANGHSLAAYYRTQVETLAALKDHGFKSTQTLMPGMKLRDPQSEVSKVPITSLDFSHAPLKLFDATSGVETGLRSSDVSEGIKEATRYGAPYLLKRGAEEHIVTHWFASTERASRGLTAGTAAALKSIAKEFNNEGDAPDIMTIHGVLNP
jgi:hypothetical protein